MCDPGPLTSEEVVKMWDTLKEKYVGLQSQVEHLTQALRKFKEDHALCSGCDLCILADAALQTQVKEKI